MHILILPSWYVSSYNTLQGIFFKEQAEALVKQGHQIGVIAIQGVGIRNIIEKKKLDFSFHSFVENGVHTYRQQYLDIKVERFIKKMKMYFFVRMFKRYIKEKGLPNIVHLHSYMAGDFAIYIKEQYNIPFVVTEHNSSFAREKISQKDLEKAKGIFSNASYNIAVSRNLKNLLKDKFSVPFDYIPNIVNINFFKLKETAKTDTYNFIHIAHLDKNKNQKMLIEAFTQAFKLKTNVKLTIVGDGAEYQKLDDLIQALKMQKQIILYGKASREEVRTLLQKSDAFVLSSQVETFGVVLIEAMACGLPVLATKCGGPETIVSSDKVGLLSDIDKKALSLKFMELYTKRLSYDPIYIREYVKNNFSEEAVCLKLNHVYEKVLSEEN